MTGWLTTHLGAVATLQRGFDLPTRLRRRGKVPVVSSSGNSGWHDHATVKAPGVVTGRYGTIGEVFFQDVDFWPLNTTLWVSNFHANDERFVYYLLQRINFAAHSGKSGVPGVNRNDLHKESVSLPSSTNEQRAISDALSDCDSLIAALERQIAKKQAIKQGMLQHRFSLPRDAELRTSLGAVATFLSGGTPDRSNAEYWSGDIPWISATTLKHIEVTSSDQRVTDRAVRTGSKMAPLGSTLMLVRGSALHSEIRAALVTSSVCFNQDVKALVPSSCIEPKFLTYSIHANAPRLLRLVTSAGNTAGVLDTKILKSFEIWLPDREIQREAVSVLDDVTNEIDVLTRRLDKAHSVKQGMMQQLLTGRIRLPAQESVA